MVRDESEKITDRLKEDSKRGRERPVLGRGRGVRRVAELTEPKLRPVSGREGIKKSQ